MMVLIRLVLQICKYSNLKYVGVSQGTNCLFKIQPISVKNRCLSLFYFCFKDKGEK